MNNLNPLEKQLESWVPRRPSARLKQRIFAAMQDGAQSASARAMSPALPGIPGWVKFAPAFCILLMVMLLGMGRQDKNSYLAVAGGSNVLASISSNLLNYCATETLSQRMNVWSVPASVATFDWTKTGHSVTTTGSFPSWKTNVHKL